MVLYAGFYCNESYHENRQALFIGNDDTAKGGLIALREILTAQTFKVPMKRNFLFFLTKEH